MRIHQSKNYFVVLYMLGFLGGILYANFIARSYITMTGIFHEYFLNQYTQTKIVAEDYFLYLLQWRVFPFAAVALLGCTKLRKAAAVVCLLWTGFSGGVLAVAAVLRMGAKGMLLCLVGIFPQLIFYILAYAMLLWYLYKYPESRWNSTKTIFVILMIGAGIITEIYLNPGIVRWFMDVVM